MKALSGEDGFYRKNIAFAAPAAPGFICFDRVDLRLLVCLNRVDVDFRGCACIRKTQMCVVEFSFIYRLTKSDCV